MLNLGLGFLGERVLARQVKGDRERKANAANWLDCGAGQPTFVTLPLPFGR
jgi:hypothetical protein